MLSPSGIQAVKDLDIHDVLSRYMTLNKKGANYVGCCPFHNEKTPSFTVFPSSGNFKCFGCGVHGDGISFIQNLKATDFIGAVKVIAGDHNITVEETESDPKEKERFMHQDALYTVNEAVCKWFEGNLPNFPKALEYVQGRWSENTTSQFRIGFAPEGWDNLLKWAKEKGFREELLLEAGLVMESKGKVFDYFRNRIIFPILNSHGRVAGFTGRDFSGDKDAPKYFNTRETEVYTKGQILYGMNFARRESREKGYVHLVEGNPDVMRLHEIGKLNTVGSCGTSLTARHIDDISKICQSVTIIGDSDKAGQKAVISSGEMLIRSGMYCNVVTLPNDDGKADPDSFFTNAEQFDEYVKENLHDYIFWLAYINKGKAQNPDKKAHLINQIAELLVCLPEKSHSLYIEQLSKEIKPKNAWTDAIKAIKKYQAPKDEEEGFRIPKTVSLSDFNKYGFYQDHNCYYFKGKSDPSRGTNFVMEPYYHLASVMNAKRIYKITNEFGYSQVIELAQKDLVGLSTFKLRIESLGNFLFEAGEYELVKLKRYLYEKTETAFEITQLGWQKNGFWAWSNGIFNGSFKNVDTNGIVKYNDTNFYLPSSSNIYQAEETLFVSERRFKFVGGEVSLNDYSQKLVQVFGDSAIFGICFYFATLFRDVIVKKFGFFPILNMFGPKGAGKTELAVSLMQFFGHQAKGPNITNTTKAALADHVALFSNSLCHLDEYKNNVEYEKVEFLKGLWDGTGRTRMNMDKDRKKETSAVDVGIMLSGQEMPTADIALFSRLIFLTFTKVEYSDQEKQNFNELKEIEKKGLTHITHSLLTHRELFVKAFMDGYTEISEDLSKELEGHPIEDRIFRNWVIPMAAYHALRDVIVVPWSYKGMLSRAATMIIRQNSETKKSNEMSIFWGIVEYLNNEGRIKEEIDYKFDCTRDISTDVMSVKNGPTKTLVYIYHSRLFQLYRVHGQQSKENILPVKTLEYYLTHCKEYLGKKTVAFKYEENGRIVEDAPDLPGAGKSVKKRKVTTAMVFDYFSLGITLTQAAGVDDFDVNEKPEPVIEAVDMEDKLPF